MGFYRILMKFLSSQLRHFVTHKLKPYTFKYINKPYLNKNLKLNINQIIYNEKLIFNHSRNNYKYR